MGEGDGRIGPGPPVAGTLEGPVRLGRPDGPIVADADVGLQDFAAPAQLLGKGQDAAVSGIYPCKYLIITTVNDISLVKVWSISLLRPA